MIICISPSSTKAFLQLEHYQTTASSVRSILRKKSPYSELFWSTFFPDFPSFGLNTERYSGPKNADQNISNIRFKLFCSLWKIVKFCKSRLTINRVDSKFSLQKLQLNCSVINFCEKNMPKINKNTTTLRQSR